MAYTPTTWVTGDTITATKLNKLEQGVADGGGKRGGTFFFEVTTENFPSSLNSVGVFVYVKKDGATYAGANTLTSALNTIQVTGNKTVVWMSTYVIPTLEDYYVVFIPSSGVTIEAATGGINTSPITITGIGSGFIITDDFTFTLNGWL